MASSNHGCHCNKRKREREGQRGAPQGSRDEKPRDRRTNQSQTGGFRRFQWWVTTLGYRVCAPSLEAAISLFTHRNSVHKFNVSFTRKYIARRFTFVVNHKLSGFFINVLFCCNIFIVLNSPINLELIFPRWKIYICPIGNKIEEMRYQGNSQLYFKGQDKWKIIRGKLENNNLLSSIFITK